MACENIPEFRALVGDQKFVELSEADIAMPVDWELAEFLRLSIGQGDAPRSHIQVMDFGCGRGRLVGQLRSAGWAAYGVDIDERFIRSGHILGERWSSPHPILSIINREGRTNFPDAFFDVIFSDQVLEHVADLGALAKEMARILKPGGIMLHRFPGRWMPIEPHYRLPVVHWLEPRSAARRLLVKTFVFLGLGVKFNTPMAAGMKTEVILEYARNHTFYRSRTEVVQTFRRHGIELKPEPLFPAWFAGKLHKVLRLPNALLKPLQAFLRSQPVSLWAGDLTDCHLSGRRVS